jgi:ribosome-binding factor A
MGTRDFSRARRVGEQIRRELAPMVQGLARDHGYGMVSVTGADVSSDLRVAKIYVSQLAATDDPQNLLKTLEQAGGNLRYLLGSELRLRNVPKLQFAFDESLLRGAKMSSLLNELVPNEPQESPADEALSELPEVQQDRSSK